MLPMKEKCLWSLVARGILNTKMKKIAITSIKLLHLVLLLILLFGWIFNSRDMLYFHIFLVPAVIIQWWLNSGTCILTNLENYISGEVKPKTEEQGQFTKSIFKKIIGRVPSDQFLKGFIYFVILLSWSISILKLI